MTPTVLTDKEKRDTTLVILPDGRRLWLPTVIYYQVRESGFNHGVKWARAHPKVRS